MLCTQDIKTLAVTSLFLTVAVLALKLNVSGTLTLTIAKIVQQSNFFFFKSLRLKFTFILSH